MIRKIRQWFKDRSFRKRVRDAGLKAAQDKWGFDGSLQDEMEIEQGLIDETATDAVDELDDAIDAYECGDKAQSLHNLQMARWRLLYQAARIEAHQQEIESNLSYRELNEWNIRHQTELNDD